MGSGCDKRDKALHVGGADARPCWASVEPRVVDAPLGLVDDFEHASASAAARSVEATEEREERGVDVVHGLGAIGDEARPDGRPIVTTHVEAPEYHLQHQAMAARRRYQALELAIELLLAALVVASKPEHVACDVELRRGAAVAVQEEANGVGLTRDRGEVAVEPCGVPCAPADVVAEFIPVRVAWRAQAPAGGELSACIS